MSALVHDDYAAVSAIGGTVQLRSWPLRRLLITAVGCAVMAISGTGLASYLDTSSSTAYAAPTDNAPLN